MSWFVYFFYALGIRACDCEQQYCVAPCTEIRQPLATGLKCFCQITTASRKHHAIYLQHLHIRIAQRWVYEYLGFLWVWWDACNAHFTQKPDRSAGLVLLPPFGIVTHVEGGNVYVCGCVCAFVFTRTRDAIFMTNSAATCLFSERLLNRNKEEGRVGNQRSPDICICHSVRLAFCRALCEFPNTLRSTNY